MKRGRKMLVAGLCLTALLSLVLNVVLAIAFRGSYEKALITQIWPGGISGEAEASALTRPAKPRVLLLGDSRMAQWGLPDLPGYTVCNSGMPGRTSAQILLAAPKVITRIQPDVLVLQAGINDLKLIGLRPDLKEVVVAQAFSNLAKLVNLGKQQKAKVLVLETWPTGPPELLRRPVWSSEIQAAVGELNARLRSLASEADGVAVVDLWARPGVSRSKLVFADALHLESAGYPILTDALEKVLLNFCDPADH